MVRAYKKRPKYLSKQLCHSAFPINESSFCSTSFPEFGGVSIPDFDLFNRYVVLSVLICICLMTYDVKASFHMLFYHLYIFFGQVSVKVFVPFLNLVLCFLLIEFFILDNSPSSDIIKHCKYFLPVLSFNYCF